MKFKSFFCLVFSMFFFSFSIVASAGRGKVRVFEYGDYRGIAEPRKLVSFAVAANLEQPEVVKYTEPSPPVEKHTGPRLVFENPYKNDKGKALLAAVTKALDNLYKRD